MNPVIGADCYQVWYVNGERHRADGPAIIYANGTRAWYVNGKRHRTDGPAIIRANGTQAWYVNDVRYHTLTEYQKAASIDDATMTFLLLQHGFDI